MRVAVLASLQRLRTPLPLLQATTFATAPLTPHVPVHTQPGRSGEAEELLSERFVGQTLDGVTGAVARSAVRGRLQAKHTPGGVLLGIPEADGHL